VIYRGSFALSRLANFYPTLMEKLVFVDVGYNAPGWALTEQNIRYVNSMVQQAMGYSVFGYFLFFNEGGAAALMDHQVSNPSKKGVGHELTDTAQPDSVQSLFHSKDEEQVKKYMGAEGGFRTWVAESMVAETPRYLSEEVSATSSVPRLSRLC
jgi:soluble epoxide hydrolase/lipid-phosphate phosphatase